MGKCWGSNFSTPEPPSEGPHQKGTPKTENMHISVVMKPIITTLELFWKIRMTLGSVIDKGK